MNLVEKIHGIKAILFDSGKVLNEPVTGSWLITPNFFKYVDKCKFDLISYEKKKEAIGQAGKHMKKHNLIINEQEEYENFFTYYSIFSKHLPELKLKDSDVQNIAKDLVYNYKKYVFFKDALELIPELSKKYKLAVVSDAWPSLENVFVTAGLREYFSSFIISSIQGVTKPDELMYKTALNELKVCSKECIFIDDIVENCDGAIRLGIKSFLMSRDDKEYSHNKILYKNYNIVRNLYDICGFIE
ncbi:HAD-IA family hydrolase [Clostridium tyrobutyricum]|uniref:HAD-IA family hydrolase n=1 Tax=Clostridium tyrobutyricum TaxID=1519 RepID=UPI000526EE3E|nr:HAD-IA family hydrolase [Clostridium tyrobutyricum]MBV4438527.1 HAD-IA family hydrolase [Clostridium tyrobutyricum]